MKIQSLIEELGISQPKIVDITRSQRKFKQATNNKFPYKGIQDPQTGAGPLFIYSMCGKSVTVEALIPSPTPSQ